MFVLCHFRIFFEKWISLYWRVRIHLTIYPSVKVIRKCICLASSLFHFGHTLLLHLSFQLGLGPSQFVFYLSLKNEHGPLVESMQDTELLSQLSWIIIFVDLNSFFLVAVTCTYVHIQIDQWFLWPAGHLGRVRYLIWVDGFASIDAPWIWHPHLVISILPLCRWSILRLNRRIFQISTSSPLYILHHRVQHSLWITSLLDGLEITLKCGWLLSLCI